VEEGGKLGQLPATPIPILTQNGIQTLAAIYAKTVEKNTIWPL
jgi:hypothetical protein